MTREQLNEWQNRWEYVFVANYCDLTDHDRSAELAACALLDRVGDQPAPATPEPTVA